MRTSTDDLTSRRRRAARPRRPVRDAPQPAHAARGAAARGRAAAAAARKRQASAGRALGHQRLPVVPAVRRRRRRRRRRRCSASCARPGPLPADKVVYHPPRTEVRRHHRLSSSAKASSTARCCSTPRCCSRARARKLKAGEYLFKRRAPACASDRQARRRAARSCIRSRSRGPDERADRRRLRENDVLAGDIAKIPPEGALLPETYSVARGTPRNELIRKMQDDQKQLRRPDLGAARSPDLPLRSPYEMVTLASIVEKETGQADERPRVAACSSTGCASACACSPTRRSSMASSAARARSAAASCAARSTQPTPYNTYVIDGLPPGPIANPGRAALEAVANPSRTQGTLFRRRRHRRPRVRRDAGPAQPQCRALAPDRARGARPPGARRRCVDRAAPDAVVAPRPPRRSGAAAPQRGARRALVRRPGRAGRPDAAARPAAADAGQSAGGGNGFRPPVVRDDLAPLVASLASDERADRRALLPTASPTRRARAERAQRAARHHVRASPADEARQGRCGARSDRRHADAGLPNFDGFAAPRSPPPPQRAGERRRTRSAAARRRLETAP